MAEELLSLKWNNHQAHFVDILTFLREQEIFIDATLACGGKLYPAHKFVLSTCSDYFKQMFTKNPNKHPIVFMKDVTCRDLEALLDFMYNGEVNVPQSSLGSLIKTAEGLQIKGLAVPDDPPVSKRDQGILRDRGERDGKLHRDNSYSPPPKRLRAARERSPHLSSSAPLYPSATLSSHIRSRSPHSSSVISGSTSVVLPPVEASVDEDSRTSVHSGVSEHSPSVNTKPNVNSQSHQNNEDSTSQSENLILPHSGEPSPGPSGLHKPTQSKEEELEIKQEEDVVDLGQDDEGDWGDGDGIEGSIDDGGGDSLTSENAQNFSDVMMPPADGSLPTGDPAMTLQLMTGQFGQNTSRSLSEAERLIDLGQYFLHESNLLTASGTGSTADSDVLGYSIDSSSTNTAPSSSSYTNHSGLNVYRVNQTIMGANNISECSERPYVCKFCWKNFKRRDHLVEHERTHTGEKPYVCSVCAKRFAKKSNLNAHVRCHVVKVNHY